MPKKSNYFPPRSRRIWPVLLLLAHAPVTAVHAESVVNVTTEAIEVTDANPSGIPNGKCSLGEGLLSLGGGGIADCPKTQTGPQEPVVLRLQAQREYQLAKTAAICAGCAFDEIVIDGNHSSIEPQVFGFNRLLTSNSQNDTTFTIRDLTLKNTYSTAVGGALNASGGALHLFNVTFSNNTAAGQGLSEGRGGGLGVDNATLLMDGCLFQDNVASLSGGGAFFLGVDGVIMNSRFFDNKSDGTSGALGIEQSTLSIVQSRFTRNQALETGGAMYPGFQDNYITINQSEFRENFAFETGGALHMHGEEMTVLNSLFVGNESTIGGAVYRDLPGISVQKIVNSTFSDNQAQAGGAIAIDNWSIAIDHSTIVENYASTGGGIWINPMKSGSVAMSHSVVMANTSNGGTSDCDGRNSRSGGYSLLGNCVYPQQSTDLSVGPLNREDVLGPLQNNGGFTASYEPEANSLAHNKGLLSFAGEPLIDQRGFPRIAEGRIDLGAAERSAREVNGWLDVVFNSSLENTDPRRYDDREVFLAEVHATDATGAFPNLGNQNSNPDPIQLGAVSIIKYPGSSFFLKDFTAILPDVTDAGDTVDLALNGYEQFDVRPNYSIHAFGFDFVDIDGDGTLFNLLACASIFDPATESCPQADIVFSMDFSSHHTQRQFVGFKITDGFRQVSIREHAVTNTNEFFGHFYVDPQ